MQEKMAGGVENPIKQASPSSAQANNLRRELLKQRFTYSTPTKNPPSAFEQEMLRIARSCPDLMEKYDPEMKILTAIQRIVVCAYNQTIQGGITPSSTPNINWNHRAWEMVDGHFFWEAGVSPIEWDDYEDEDEHEEAANVDPHYGRFNSRAYEKCLQRARGSRFVVMGYSVQDWLWLKEDRDR
ncbi:uncharacterized protein ASPGLDRAFT_1505530 [Aspergillus glaucus CBS 516.65]|uniref:Uncharacterized protein n=1 Tax=Aspergillus glaucus CBS 516.65 TaxID=1160497 RepID=A0A1L9VVB7_ASPGL|nr:hypothetical protein ASPGLDRAFT_1505530 [Aspergillus glaucus CBS 516.65]OJJ87852.1 hypothetical protein ASPGLDRAFT_1505530 [Aspergillus glaucus CBS 516.65]